MEKTLWVGTYNDGHGDYSQVYLASQFFYVDAYVQEKAEEAFDPHEWGLDAEDFGSMDEYLDAAEEEMMNTISWDTVPFDKENDFHMWLKRNYDVIELE